MECSCGSTSFAPSSATLKSDAGALLFEYSACRACGRQGAGRLSDKGTGAIIATGFNAVMRVQQIEAAEALFDVPAEQPGLESPSVEDSVHAAAENKTAMSPLSASTQDQTFSVANTPQEPRIEAVSDPHATLEHTGPAEDAPVHGFAKGQSTEQRVNDRGRHYLMWQGETRQAQVLYFQHLYEDHSEVIIPWIGLQRSTDETGQGCADLLLTSLSALKMALEQHFDEQTVSTAVTCAPPQAVPLAEIDPQGRVVGRSQDDDAPAEEYLTFAFLDDIPIVEIESDSTDNMEGHQDQTLDDNDPLAHEASQYEEQLALF
ncbi:hypothetical protein [Marinobacterium sp. BA1]|uniref:hypothetical protein n=1 Tax=Marinobacterium sp. BA1 TaxID=3138931 RepID=UPI0032E7624D